MVAQLAQKELLHHLLDFRFIIVFALCATLSALSVYVGMQDYSRRVQEYSDISKANRQSLQAFLDRGVVHGLIWNGYQWNRRPEVLSPIIYGLSGVLGQEVLIRHQEPPVFG